MNMSDRRIKKMLTIIMKAPKSNRIPNDSIINMKNAQMTVIRQATNDNISNRLHSGSVYGFIFNANDKL